jgi:hypothetical protein
MSTGELKSPKPLPAEKQKTRRELKPSEHVRRDDSLDVSGRRMVHEHRPGLIHRQYRTVAPYQAIYRAV